MTGPWESWLDQPLAGVWAATLLHFLWQGMAVACGHAVCLLALPRSPAQRRYLCGVGWSLVLGCCPIVTFGVLATKTVPTVSEREVAPWPAAALPGVTAAKSWESLQADGPVVARPIDPSPRIAPWMGPRNGASFDWQRWLVAGWFVGVAALSLRLAGGGCLVLWLRRRVQSLPPELANQVEALRRRLRVSGAVVVAASNRVATAIACGLWRPMVLLPVSWLADMSPSMLQAVIAHELAHIRRYDLWINLLQRLLETLWFYHPAVWWISMSVRRERESSCDELAVSVLPSRVHYAETLEFLAERRLAGTAPLWLSAGIGGNRMYLLQRIQHVLGTATPRTNGAIWPALCLVAVLTVGTCAVVRSAAVADPQDPLADETATGQLTDAADEDTDRPERSDKVDVAFGANEFESNREQLRRLQRELRHAQLQLREYQVVIENLKLELDRTRAQFTRQQQRIERLAEAGTDQSLAEPRSPLSARDRDDSREPRDRRTRDRASAATHEAARLEFQRRLLDHRQESVELQMHQAKDRVEKELALRERAVQSEIERRKRQFEIQSQMAALESEQEALQHKRQAREIARRIEETRLELEQAKDDNVRAPLAIDLAALQDELAFIEEELELARKRRELATRARKVDVETQLQTTLEESRIEAKMQLQAELRECEMQLRELQLERERVELEWAAARQGNRIK